MSDRAKPGGDGTPVLLPLRKMAARLGVPSSWLKERAQTGEVPGLLAGDRWLFREDAVREAVAAMALADSAKGGAQ